MRVYAYNGVATDNFQVYHSNTSVLPRPPSSCTPTTRAGINGLLCPIAALGPVTVPSVVGMTEQAARNAIAAAQLVVGTVTTASTPPCRSRTTISQNPAAGTSVSAGTAVISSSTLRARS